MEKSQQPTENPNDIPPGAIEVIKGHLYFVSRDAPPERPVTSSVRFVRSVNFATDPSFVYTSYFADFGPFDLGITHQFCHNLHAVMQEARDHRKFVVFYAGSHEHKRANSAACLMAYLIFILDFSVERAYRPFCGMNPPFIPFRDAGFCVNTYPITVLDIARAFRKAKTMGHYDHRTFSLTAYQNMGKLQNGDMSWIVPGKFIAFSGPLTKKRQLSPGVFTLTPEQYVPLFKDLNVTCVVRFNEKMYDRRVFLNHGIRHVDLFYEDGGNPTDAILNAFLQLCEQERGAIAVHCKAGLGRTGTNIAAYMMKHYGYSAKEAIAWCRVCRPGCVVGPQQQYLSVMEAKLWRDGEEYQLRRQLNPGATDKRRGSSGKVVPGSVKAPPGSAAESPSAPNADKTSHFKAIHTGLQHIMQQQEQPLAQPAATEAAGAAVKRKNSASSQSTGAAPGSAKKKSLEGLTLPHFSRNEGVQQQSQPAADDANRRVLSASMPTALSKTRQAQQQQRPDGAGSEVDDGAASGDGDYPRAFDYPGRPSTCDSIFPAGRSTGSLHDAAAQNKGGKAPFVIPPPHSAANAGASPSTRTEGVALQVMATGAGTSSAPRRVHTAYAGANGSTTPTAPASAAAGSRLGAPTYVSDLRASKLLSNPAHSTSFGVPSSSSDSSKVASGNNNTSSNSSVGREAWSESSTPRLGGTTGARPLSSSATSTPRGSGKMPSIAGASKGAVSPYAMPVAPNSALKKRTVAK